MNAMNIPSVKVEHDADDYNPHIKSELPSAAASPAAMSEDDVYEDTGDLDFSQVQSVFLMKLPHWLWENWSKIDDDEEIQLGMIRVEELGKGPNGEQAQKMTMLLDSSLKSNQELPKEYNLVASEARHSNMYIFSEKDTQPVKAKQEDKSGNAPGQQQDLKVPPGSRPEGVKKNKPNRNRPWQPYFRKAAPKHTALAGIVQREISCFPVESAEYTRILVERNAEAVKPKRQTKFLDRKNSNAGVPLAPGMLGTTGFENFIQTAQPTRAKAQDQKAARMPQNDLIDLIYDCFSRYNYWSLKALKAEVNQPEAYLKSTLEKVADLVKSGRFAMTWTLKPEARRDRYADLAGNEERAPDAPFGTDGPGDDPNEDGGEMESDLDEDDEETKMEDVLPA